MQSVPKSCSFEVPSQGGQGYSNMQARGIIPGHRENYVRVASNALGLRLTWRQ
jgi:hypothetical protein